MKKLLSLISLTILLYACSAVQTQKDIRYYAVDFRPHTEKGFLFTPEMYEGQYESIGMLSTVIFPGVKEVPTKKSFSGITMGYDRIYANEVIDSMYVKAVSMGADAFVRFEIKPAEKWNGDLLVQGIEVVGFAIKRKK